jgi:hypothetical protein
MGTAEPAFERTSNPVDLVEHVAALNDWSYYRTGEDEVVLNIAGTWCDYLVTLNWRDDLEVLHLACTADLKIPEQRVTEVYRLIAGINEHLWMGHCDLWTEEGALMFRHSLILNGAEPTTAQCEAIVAAAIDSCERYYQAFQFVVWAGHSADDAMAGAMFETVGRA